MPRLSLFDEGPPEPCPTPFNMADYVLSAGRSTPEKPALEILSGEQAEIWTHGALEAAVMAMAGALQARGLVPTVGRRLTVSEPGAGVVEHGQ